MSTCSGVRRLELQRRLADGDDGVLRQVDLADASVADERAVPRAEVADADAALGRDELHVHGAHLAIIEDEVAGLVPANHLRLGSDVEGMLVGLPAVDLE